MLICFIALRTCEKSTPDADFKEYHIMMMGSAPRDIFYQWLHCPILLWLYCYDAVAHMEDSIAFRITS